MQANLLQPSKKLHFSEDHFQGFWVQLLTLIRRNEHADAYLDGILRNPMRDVFDANADNASNDHPYTVAVQALYVAGNLGDPVGTFPDYAQLEDDPIKAIRDFAIATNSGTVGGVHPTTGRVWVAARQWARGIYDRNLIFRQACKHIWETVVATFSSAEAATMIAGLPYGSGPKLLARVKATQQRQTPMALVTLLINLITIRLKPDEKIAGIYGRVLAIKARLENWDPPIYFPEILYTVCMIRLLPRLFNQTRVIIMTQKDMTLVGAKDMLLDVENKDAERVAAAVGSSGTSTSKDTAKTATALVTNAGTSKRKKKKKKRSKGDSKKSAKYHSEGPCSHHGAKCGHASSECYVLHPELKPTGAVAGEAEALAVSEAVADKDRTSPTPYGFMNEDALGYALVGSSTNARSNAALCVIACGLMSTGTLSTIVVQRAIAGRDLSLKACDVRGECPVSPVMRTVAHLARTVPLCETHDKALMQSHKHSRNTHHRSTNGLKTNPVKGQWNHVSALQQTMQPVKGHSPGSGGSPADGCGRGGPRMDEHMRKLTQRSGNSDNPEVIRGVRARADERQDACFALVKWLITNASLPYWEVLGDISDMEEVSDLLQLPDALQCGATHNDWSETKNLFRRLSTESATKVYDRLTSVYLPMRVHQGSNCSGEVKAHVSTNKLVTTSHVTTAALKLLQYDEDQLPVKSALNADVKVDKLIVTPENEQVGLMMRDVRLQVVISHLPVICIAGSDATTCNEYFGVNEPVFRQCDNSDNTIGYAYMINSKSSTTTNAVPPFSIPDPDPMPEYVDPNLPFRSMYGNFAISVYEEWAKRNPERARMAQLVREGVMHEQRKWDAAERTLEAMRPATHNPAPREFTAAKGLQKLMRHECTRQTSTHSVKQCAGTGKRHTRTTKKYHPRSKKDRAKKKTRRPKNYGWSRKPKPKRKIQSQSATPRYTNVLRGNVLRGRQTPARNSPLQRRLARTGGTRDLHAERARKLQQPVPVSFDNNQDMIGVTTKYAFAPGLTTSMTHPTGCPRAAVLNLESANQLPMTIPVQVPGRFTMMIRVGHTPLPEQDCITIPGTALVLQVERILARGCAYVNGPSESSTVLDSGATEHISPRVAGPLSEAPISTIHGLSGKGTPVTGMGTVNQVKNVMCCPGSSRRLLSVSRLLEQLGGKIVFTSNKAYHVADNIATPLATRNGKGLYRVVSKDYDLNAEDTERASALVGNAISTDLARERITALHRTFGHVSKEALRTIVKQHNFAGVLESHLQLLQPCNACMLGKSHKAPKGRLSAEKATTFGYRLCADCCGPFRTLSVGGAKYLLVVIDEFSSWTWAFPLTALTLVHEKLQHVIEIRLHQRDDTTVKIFRSDGGREFCNHKVDAILDRHGVERETTCPNTSYQNGKAERRIRTIFERVRTCLSDAGLSPGFWAEAAVYAAYTLNRTPSARGTSPFFKRYGRPPKVSHLRPFGNPCVIYRDRSIAGKIRDAGVPGIFLGYGYINGKKGFRVRIGNTNNVATVMDVVCGVYPSGSARVQLLQPEPAATPITPPARRVARTRDIATAVPRDEHTTPDTTITTLDNEQEVEATLRVNAVSGINEDEPSTPNRETQNNVQDIFTVGAKVEGNWRGHGKYYDATITGVHKAGRRVKYDLVYDDDNEREPGVSAQLVRTRRAPARSTSTGLCAHALVTDCNPIYIAAVPDMARAHITPKHYGEAMKSKDKVHWLKAIFDELKTVEDQRVFKFVAKLPDGVKALTSVWVFKVKCGPDGKISRYKARITVNGKSQIYGINYSETFSPVAFATTIRLMLAIALSLSLGLRQYDIKGAFLYADLPEEERVYMRTPPGYKRKGYWYLMKTLYGLRQSPRRFNQHLDGTLTKLGWKSCIFDPCLYRHTTEQAYLVAVVDDMILASPSEEFTNSFYKNMSKVYDIKDLGVPKYVIGVRVDMGKESLKLLQDRYITDLHEKHKGNTRPTATPAVANLSMCMTGIKGQKESPLLPVPKVYRSLVGGLMYTLITRPDVAAAVSVCARYLAQPRQAHMNAALRVLSYLYQTRHKALTYHATDLKHLRITVYADSSWADDADTRRSRYGFALYVGRCLVSWRSKLHSCIALSTAEAEYCAATEAAKQIKWVASLIRFMLPKLELPPALLYEDNAACRAMVTSAQISGRNKHFELKQHFIRELYNAKVFEMMEVSTQDQIADIFTKALARPMYEIHRDSLLQGITLDLIKGAATEGGS